MRVLAPPNCVGSIPSSEAGRLRMAIRAQETQVLRAIVEVEPVAVVYLQHEALAAPLIPEAARLTGVQPPGLQESSP